ncbi:helix-turn-helix domain-containing protein [Nocardioides bruguierae]|uniref:AraC-like ligand-binding domain-containing protein n=1 Tax=Nocardioides bruguierae TaxID=2945102 RepID=UPI00202192DF|nr:helix-turn-helix domain-containing protein [Nocardioides bruguierae]MCL8023950.1 helix-turn-helix domain-containing protein [Nocardioides bruguierae]
MGLIRIGSDEEWRAAVSSSFYELSLSRVSPGFTASIQQRDLGRGVRVAEVTSGATELWRTSRLVTTAPTDEVLLLVQLAGRSRVRQADRTVTLSAGMATLCDPLVEYRVENATASQQLVMMLPRAVLRASGVPVDALRLRPIGGEVGSLRALIALGGEAVSFTDDGLQFLESDAVTTAMLGLTRSLFARVGGQEAGPRPREALVAEALEVVRQHAPDPAFDVDAWASRVGVSRRLLTDLLRGEGTPSAVLRTERLRRARAELSDPLEARRSIAEIGARWGFVDATTFSRAFKREFGDLPSDLRRPLA